MPKRSERGEVADLTGKMLDALEARRARGDGAYPPTLRDLSRECGDPSDDRLLKAVATKAFTARVSVPVKVARKPSPDSPVYFIEDVPKKARTKPKPEGETAAGRSKRESAELAGRMLAVLEAQHQLGCDAYPPTLARLAELSNAPSTPRAISAAGTKAFVDRAVVGKLQGRPCADAPVVLKDGVEPDVLGLVPALLTFALRHAARTEKTHAFSAAALGGKLPERLRGPFRKALKEMAGRQALPPEFAWILVKGDPLFFAVADLRPDSLRPASAAGRPPFSSPPTDDGPASPPPQARDFAAAFREAFERIDRRDGMTNFVKLADLRRALPDFDRERFDAGLRQLRVAREFSLDSHEGRYEALSPEDRDAAVREAGSLLVYVSRR